MEKFSLAGKTVLITGASSGFGHHFAGVVAEAGASVVLGARRIDKIEARVQELVARGARVLGVPLDVNDPDSAAAFLGAAEAEFGTIDVLINNAGVEAGAKTYTMIDEEDWDYVLNTNLKSVWRLSTTPSGQQNRASQEILLMLLRSRLTERSRGSFLTRYPKQHS